MNYDITPLTDVMAALLGENGCPWDKEQTHESLRKNLLEESHEVIEAIDTNDMEHLKEELGDLLLQIVFHAKLAEQEGAFNFNDVVESITAKMIRRHPHIFADVKADDAEAVLTNWEAIKKQEKAEKGITEQEEPASIMSKLPPTLPALMKAEKVQQKAHRVGFDWDDIEGPKAKIAEEVAEIDDAIAANGAGIKLRTQHIGGAVAIGNLLPCHQRHHRCVQRSGQWLQQRNIRQPFRGFPFRYCFAADTEFFCQLVLCQPFRFPQLFYDCPRDICIHNQHSFLLPYFQYITYSLRSQPTLRGIRKPALRFGQAGFLSCFHYYSRFASAISASRSYTPSSESTPRLNSDGNSPRSSASKSSRHCPFS